MRNRPSCGIWIDSFKIIVILMCDAYPRGEVDPQLSVQRNFRKTIIVANAQNEMQATQHCSASELGERIREITLSHIYVFFLCLCKMSD